MKDDLGNYLRTGRASRRHVLRKSRSTARRSAGIDFREVCDPYIPMAPETRGPVASLKDDFQHCDDFVARAVLLCQRCSSEPIGAFAGIRGPG